MLLRVSKQGCSRVVQSLRPCRVHARLFSIPATAISSIGNGTLEQSKTNSNRTVAPRIEGVRGVATFTAKKTPDGRKLMKLMNQGRHEDVIMLLSDVVLTERGGAILVEMVQRLLQGLDAEHVKGLFIILKALPNAAYANSDLCQAVWAELFDRSGHRRMELAKQFGILCASKGYSNFVALEIMPYIFTKASELEFDRWKHEVDEAMEAFNGRRVEEEMFEEDEQEYSLFGPSAMQPSVLQRVEATLPEILPEPNDDMSFFEDGGGDYLIQALSRGPIRDHQSTEVLEQLAADGEFRDAYEMLQELRHLHTAIPNSAAYFKPVMDACRQLQRVDDDIKYEDKEAYALNWLKLIPIAHDIRAWTPQLQQIHDLIFRSPLTHLSFIKKASVLFAQKGFAGRVVSASMETIFLYGTQEESEAFLQEFDDANARYWEIEPELQEHRTKVIKTYSRTNAVFALITTKKFERAYELFPDPYLQGYHLPPWVYFKFQDLIRKWRHPDRYKYQELGRDALRRVHEWRDSRPAKVLDPSAELNMQPIGIPEQWGTHRHNGYGVRMKGSLIETLLDFRRAILKNGRAPIPTVMLNFIIPYLDSGHSRGLTLLLNLALKHNREHAHLILLAEMLYYYERRRPELVIDTFVEHYHLIGVPTKEMLQIYERSAPIPTIESDPDPVEKKRIHYTRSDDPFKTSTKLIPPATHTGLVWHALCAIEQDPNRVRSLYRKLYQLASTRLDAEEELSNQGIRTLADPKPENTPVLNSWAFTPFFRKVGRYFGVSEAAKVLGDIVELKLRPDVYHLTELAGLYARVGDEEKALTILSKLEASVKERKEQHDLDSDSNPFNASSLDPDEIMYKSIFVGFVQGRRWTAAENVDQRYRAKYEVQPNPDEPDAYYEACTRMQYYKEQCQTWHLPEQQEQSPVNFR
ncbi:hypothetical protein FA15DRAFT_616429 [Coprinopsis marcescibilis]|uniref:Uncharacterized protein n=1 Tax=Coprinopsis marcescibilis TaxID=230819 RepID=A0A5C3KZL1_COPMA|nr:hypothetical protein FA15DRAFT_616429 [Coprinopsis marcescibilis]